MGKNCFAFDSRKSRGKMAPGETEVAANNFVFPNFDILSGDSDHSDHYYIGTNQSTKTQDCFNNPSSAVSNKVAKEWKILKKNLPEHIYVRVYEQRVDLIRAVIVGAAGTPYHDGLFFFDIVLPSDYPERPPKVYYHAHGLELNPNLYACGKVCLSLIHTWEGDGVELWTPSRSTILQLLVSIQGLVLNAKPYFNEPKYANRLHDVSGKWIKTSVAYNEEVFIKSCRTMLYNLKKPPKGFQSFVVQHFRKRGDIILAAIQAYGNGEAAIGEYQDGESVSSSSVHVAAEFKTNLKKMHSRLSLAFEQGWEKSETSATVKARSTYDKSSPGLFSKFLNWMFG